MPRGPIPDPAANRTDLNAPGTPTTPPPGLGQPNGQPVAVPTGTPYGEAGQLQQAQQAVPLPEGPATPQAPPPHPSAPGQPVDMNAANQAARNFQMPNLGSLTRPTERPNEAVTAGLPSGPPPITGSPMPQQSTGSISSMLAKMAAATGSAALSQLASRATAVGQ